MSEGAMSQQREENENFRPGQSGRPSFESEYRRITAALEATCRREEAERAVLVACKQVLDLYFVWATSGPDRDQDYIDGVLSAQLGQIDEILALYGVTDV